MRGDDLVGRFGGDEFVVVLLGLHGTTQVRPLIESIRSRIAEPITVLDREVVVTASLGMAIAAANETASDVLERADAALYCSKRSGGNTATIV